MEKWIIGIEGLEGRHEKMEIAGMDAEPEREFIKTQARRIDRNEIYRRGILTMNALIQTDKTPDFAAGIADSLTKLIEAAPEGDCSAESPQTLSAAIYVREAWGWGRKYCSEIALHGEEWFSALEIAKPVIASGGIVVMVGDRGPGKTQMAAELARTGNWPADKNEFSRGDGLIVHKSKTATYRRAMDVFLELREAAKNHVKSSEREVIDKLASVGLLVIDEFQERGDTEWENRIMKNLLDKRYASERPTILIANMKRKEIFDALGASIVDRARENGKSIEFNWPSYRQQS